MTAPIVRTFLPWYRRGLAAGISEASVRTAGRVGVPLRVSLSGRAQPADVPIELAGPADVGGLDRREIVRVHPFDGCASFEPSLIAHAELATPDLPWRFTPLAPDAHGRLRPWLVLVVVDEEAAELRGAQAGGSQVLACPSSQLPPLGDSWAWAHVQVTRRQGEDIETVVRDTPERAVARLLCPRRLRGGRAYLACIVPGFEGGRRAGLGAPPAAAADPLADAWVEGAEAELPVYFHWRFSTGHPGSFETLVRALTPRGISVEAATRDVGVDDPGWGLRRIDPATTRARLSMYGLLRPLGAPDLTAPDDPELHEGIRAAIDQVHERAQIRPPLYGQDYVDRRSVPGAAEEPAWFGELNLDLRHRIVAGLGAMAVRVLQEDLVAEAWHQLAKAHRPPDEEARRELTDVLNSAIDAPSTSAGGTVLRALQAVGTPTTLQRLMRPGGTLARRAGALAVAPAAPRAHPTRRRALTADLPREGFAPRLERPAYEFLRMVHPDWVLPGLAGLAPESVTVLETSGSFVEAFLLGLNHEFGRELAWRRYPVDRRGTFVVRFWPAATGGPSAEVPDIADWTTGGLGRHVTQDGSLVLLVRGELLRRHPDAHIYALRDGASVVPTFTGRWGEDVTLVGFPLTVEEAFADGSDLRFVIEEEAQRARFGCDEATDSAPAQPGVWRDCQWGNADFAQRTHLPAEGPLAGLKLAVSASGDPEYATWGADAAHMAVITQRPPLRAVFPGARWRPPTRLDREP